MLRRPEKAEQAVVEAWRQVVVRHGESKSRITEKDVRRVTNPPAAGRRIAGWFEIMGTAADRLIAANKDLVKLEAELARKRGLVVADEPAACWTRVLRQESFSEKAKRYAAMARDLMTRLEAIAALEP